MVETPHVAPWWLWPNVLSLDAPAVAVIWQQFLASAFGVVVPLLASVVLGLVVWGIYLADRYFDGRAGMAEQPRHRFAANYPVQVAGLAAVTLFVAAALSVKLPASYLAAGGILAAIVVGYFALIDLVNAKPSTMNGGKEFLVGLLFAAGVAVPLLAEHPNPLAWLLPVVGFGLVCWLNCRFIDKWEEATPNGDTNEMLIVVAAIACAALSPFAIGCALAAGCGLLVLLHIVRRQTGPRSGRVLADVALLTPLIVWCWP